MAVRPGRDIKAPFITSGDPDSVNDTFPSSTTVGSAYDLKGQLGAIYRSPDGTKEYIYAQFSSTSTGKTPAANQICFWVVNSTANLASAGEFVVDNQTSANSGTSVANVAGILRVACTRGNGVWLLRKSAISVPVVSTSTIALTAGGASAVFATTASGEATVISSTSTVAPAGGIVGSPWFVGGNRLGWVASTATGGAFVGSTATGWIGVNIPVFLDIE